MRQSTSISGCSPGLGRLKRRRAAGDWSGVVFSPRGATSRSASRSQRSCMPASEMFTPRAEWIASVSVMISTGMSVSKRLYSRRSAEVFGLATSVPQVIDVTGECPSIRRNFPVRVGQGSRSAARLAQLADAFRLLCGGHNLAHVLQQGGGVVDDAVLDGPAHAADADDLVVLGDADRAGAIQHLEVGERIRGDDD